MNRPIQYDRAAVVAPVVLQIADDAELKQDERLRQIEQVLRDEFINIEQQTAADRGDCS